jgi:hypothetical protein
MVIGTGDQFRKAGEDAFGKPSSVVWKVMDIRPARDGRTYAMLSRNGDRSLAKQVVLAALADRDLYEPV